MNKSWIMLAFISATSSAQTVEERLVDIVYGEEIIRGTYQVVIDDEYDAHVIPYDRNDLESKIPTNVVISSGRNKLSYIEAETLAEREAEIYEEVNRRTENAPYTILFAGRIPDHIQKERMKMMPEVGIFGTQLKKLDDNQGDLEMKVDHPDTQTPDLGEFLPIEAGGGSQSGTAAESMLEDMIGG